MNHIKMGIVYFLFTLGMFTVCIYYLYPEADVNNYVVHRVSQSEPDVEMLIGGSRPAFPPGLSFSDLSVTYRKYPAFDADRLIVTPELLTLASENRRIAFSGKAYDGEFEGDLLFRENSDLRKPDAARVNISGFELNKIRAIGEIPGYKISGALNGELHFHKTDSGDTADVELTVVEGNLDFLAPVLNLGNITFKLIDVSLAYDKNKLEIKRFTGTGVQMDTEVSGSITIRQPLEKSLLDLSGRVKPHASFIASLGEGLVSILFKNKDLRQGIEFKLRGTIENRKFSWK